jgi:hypothetical protein
MCCHLLEILQFADEGIILHRTCFFFLVEVIVTANGGQ